MSGPLVTGSRVRLTPDAEWVFADLVGAVGVLETLGGNVASVAWDGRDLVSWMQIDDLEMVEGEG